MRRAASRRRALLPLFALGLSLCCGCGGDGGSSAPAPPAAELDLVVRELVEPPARFGPWTRWWWPGNDVDAAELEREVGVLADAGFAGAEIQAFDAGLDPDAPPEALARRRSFDSPSFYGNLIATLEAARARGLAIDLNLGSGWATGGSHVPVDDSLGSLFTREHLLEGPVTATLDVSAPERPVFYAVSGLLEGLFDGPLARWLPERARRIAVLAAPIVGGGRNPNPLVLTDRLDLDPARLVDLTELVNPDGTLDVTLPAGAWAVVAFYVGPDGELPQLSADPEPAYVVDLFDAGAVEAHLEHLLGARTGLAPYHGDPLRAFFHDSLELRTERFFADDGLAEFERRRGYDLRPWLPVLAVPGADNVVFESAGLVREAAYGLGDLDERIRYDHVRTISELYAERYGATAERWAGERGLLSRMQAYGAELDPILVGGSAQIPESEQLFAGGSDLFLEIVSSAAMLHGRPIVSAESFVWMSRDGMTTPTKMKAAADKAFAAGVNQLVVHGFPYATTDPAYGATGWQPFSSPFAGTGGASSQVNEASPFWPDVPALNRYVARCQRALRSGRRELDVLVLYPWLTVPGTLNGIDLDEPLFNGNFPGEPEVGLASLIGVGSVIGLTEIDPRARWLAARREALDALVAGGWDWGWVNEERLASLTTGDERFRAILVTELDRMRPEAAEALARLAEEGVPVLLAGVQPDRQPGFADRERGDARVRAAVERVRAAPGARVLATDGEAPAALAAAGVAPAVRLGGDLAGSVAHERRRLDDGASVVFVHNRTQALLEGSVAPAGCAELHLLDPWSGVVSGPYARELPLRLDAYGSALVLCDVGAARLAGVDLRAPAEVELGPAFAVHVPASVELEVAGDDVASGSFTTVLGLPAPDWRTIPELRLSSSPGRYRASVQLSAAELERASSARMWLRARGGAAVVRVNDGPPLRVPVPAQGVDLREWLVAGANRIEVELTSPLRNRYVGFAAAGDPAYAQYAGEEDTLLPTGLEELRLELY